MEAMYNRPGSFPFSCCNNRPTTGNSCTDRGSNDCRSAKVGSVDVEQSKEPAKVCCWCWCVVCQEARDDAAEGVVLIGGGCCGGGVHLLFSDHHPSAKVRGGCDYGYKGKEFLSGGVERRERNGNAGGE